MDRPTKPEPDAGATLHFMCGKLASGKTTLAKQIAREDDAVLICEDVWLSRLFPVIALWTFDDYLKRSACWRAALGPHVADLLRRGVSVVFDFAGNVPREREWVRSIFEDAGAGHLLHYVHVSDAVCKARLRGRNAQMPEGSQFTTDQQFDAITAYFVPPSPGERFRIQLHRAEDDSPSE